MTRAAAARAWRRSRCASPPAVAPSGGCANQPNGDRNSCCRSPADRPGLGGRPGGQPQRPPRGGPAAAVGHALPAVAGGARADGGAGGPGGRGVRRAEDPEGPVAGAGVAGVRGAGVRRAGRADGDGLRPLRPAEVRRVAGGVPPRPPSARHAANVDPRDLARAAAPDAGRPAAGPEGRPRRRAGRRHVRRDQRHASATRCSATPGAATTRSGRWASGSTCWTWTVTPGFAYHTLVEQLLRSATPATADAAG